MTMRALPLELAIVVPTFNESGNIQELFNRLSSALQGIEWEVIFVDDDSPDGTAEHVRLLALHNPKVRCLHRVNRRGLSSACVEGLLSTPAPYLAVMDADLQHDETRLPVMLQALKQSNCDLVVGTRYMEGGGVGAWDESRQLSSRFATWLSQRILGVTLKDPMSGFFMLRREAFMGAVYDLSSMGFKILLDIVVSSPQKLSFTETPYTFRPRHAGESKLDARVAWDYLLMLADKTLGRYIPTSLISFGAVGSLGVAVHLMTLYACLLLLQLSFTQSQTAAVFIAMVFNFQLNNLLTYRDKQLMGWLWWWGLTKFMAACSLGALANVGVASWLHGGGAGWLWPSLAGILVGLMWNYGATAILVWPQRRKK
jgi:dolichol-phosphate mannosyltransferase